MIREVKQVSHERIIHDAKVKVGSSHSFGSPEIVISLSQYWT